MENVESPSPVIEEDDDQTGLWEGDVPHMLNFLSTDYKKMPKYSHYIPWEW